MHLKHLSVHIWSTRLYVLGMCHSKFLDCKSHTLVRLKLKPRETKLRPSIFLVIDSFWNPPLDFFCSGMVKNSIQGVLSHCFLNITVPSVKFVTISSLSQELAYLSFAYKSRMIWYSIILSNSFWKPSELGEIITSLIMNSMSDWIRIPFCLSWIFWYMTSLDDTPPQGLQFWCCEQASEQAL